MINLEMKPMVHYRGAWENNDNNDQLARVSPKPVDYGIVCPCLKNYRDLLFSYNN